MCFLFSDPSSVFEGIEMEEAVKNELISNIKRRMTPQPVKIRARKFFFYLILFFTFKKTYH